MPGENELGDLIVEMRLDDTKYRADVKRAIVDTQAQVKSMPQNRDLFGRFMGAGDKLNPYKAMVRDAEFAAKANAKVASSFRHVGSSAESIRALHGALFLVTGETGFFAIEALRAANHVSKLSAASGGMGAALAAAGTSALGFVAKLNPVVLVLGGLTAAYFLLKKATGNATEQNAEFSKSLEEIRNEANKLGATEAELRAMRERDAAKKLPFGGAMPGGQVNPSLIAYSKEEDRLESRKAMIAMGAAGKETRKNRESARRAILMDLGLASPSDFEGDVGTRLLMQFKERAEMMRKSAGDVPGFGIGSVNSNAFRFGPGAMGSVIGQQSEEKKTNEKLDAINKTLKEEFAILANRLLTDPTLGSSPFPMPGL